MVRFTAYHCFGGFKGKKQASSAELQVQEFVEQEESEKRPEKARIEKIVVLSPEDREEMRKADEATCLVLTQQQAFEDEMEHQIWEAKESIKCIWALRLLIEQGKATDYEKAEMVELLGRAKSPDVEDVLDEELELGDESMDPEADPKEVEGTRKQNGDSLGKETAEELSRELLNLTSQVLLNNEPNHQAARWYLLNTEGIHGEEPVVKQLRNCPMPPSKHLDNVLTPKSEEDAVGEMDVDSPEPSRQDQVQEWLAGLSPIGPVQSVVGNDKEDVRQDENNKHPEDSGGMEVDRPGEIGLFLQLAPDLILIPTAVEPELKVEGPTEEEMLVRLAGQKAEKAEEERAAAEQLHARCNAIKAKLVVKPKKIIVKKELPPDTELLDELPTGFRPGLRPNGIVEFVLDDDNKPVASGSGTRPDPDPKQD
ncbi:hypothetical protein B0H14DRAFT_3461900 [Mycena olivaceomarginata]|nr:hypothetical protein B0H14DRAFT_3461900 [Mycena olivaceomarginata]